MWVLFIKCMGSLMVHLWVALEAWEPVVVKVKQLYGVLVMLVVGAVLCSISKAVMERPFIMPCIWMLDCRNSWLSL